VPFVPLWFSSFHFAFLLNIPFDIPIVLPIFCIKRGGPERNVSTFRFSKVASLS